MRKAQPGDQRDQIISMYPSILGTSNCSWEVVEGCAFKNVDKSMRKQKFRNRTRIGPLWGFRNGHVEIMLFRASFSSY